MESQTGLRVDAQELDGIPLFRHLTAEEKKEICQVTHAFFAYQPDEYIIRQGEEGRSLHILMKGAAHVCKEPDQVIARLFPGDTFGEMSFITKRTRSTNVIASDDAVVLKIDDQMLEKVSARVSDKIKTQIIEMLALRLEKMNETIVSLSRFAPPHS